MDLYLVRHPQPEVEIGLCYGSSDLALREDPAVEAARLRALLPQRYTLVASPLRRAHELAVAIGPTPLVDARLQEVHFGDWELMPFDDIPREAFDSWAADLLGFCAPGGESVGDMAARAWAAFETHAGRADDALLLVAHAGPLRAILGRLLHLPPERWLGLEFDYAALTHVRLDEQRGARLRCFNR